MVKKQDEKENNEAVSGTVEQEAKPCAQKTKKSVRVKRLVILIALLLLTGSVSYVVTPFILPYLSSTPLVHEEEVVSVEEAAFVEPAQSSQSEQEVVEEIVEPVEPESEPVIEAIPVEEEKTSVIQEQEKQPENLPSLRPQKISSKIPLLKAMQLYEAFQKGEECRPLLEELIALAEDEPEMGKKLMALLRFCLENPFPQQMKEAFYDDKKRAILRILQSENPIWTAYLKMIPYTVVDIHKKGVLSDAPMDILYRIQSAVDANQFSLVLDLIAKLPENVQPALYDLQQCALREVAVYQTLQDLIQTLAEGVENE